MELINETLKKFRKKLSKNFIKNENNKIKSKQYFSEDNALKAIAKMDKSGLGRKGHRNLCKKLEMTWDDYKLAIDIVRNPDKEEALEIE